MRTISDIIGLWKTAEAFARDVGVTGLVARSWKYRESIPANKWADVVDAAERAGKPGVTLDVLARIAADRTRVQAEAEGAAA